jgi:uncharacterized protein (UPF0548 family)
MLSLRRPSADSIRRFLAAQSQLNFTYASVGATAKTPPAGFVLDHTRIKLGEGEPVFRAAQAALERWQQFDLSWMEAWPPETPIRAGEVVAIVARAVGLWWLNACKIVYVVNEPGPIRRFGFANGTLPDHPARGEERFLIEREESDDSVWYDILAFSRPNRFLTRLGYPFVRRTQAAFRRESAAAMLKAVLAGDGEHAGQRSSR